MNQTQLQPVVDLLCARFGWGPAVMGWMSGMRVFMKFFNSRLQAKLTAMMVAAAQSGDDAERTDWEGVLSARWYRVTAFVVDLVLSLKLPRHAEFLQQTTAKDRVLLPAK